jgi:phosphatidylglycerol:prolipoprotein diacylglycerol transferase
MHPGDFLIGLWGFHFNLQPYAAAVGAALCTVAVGSWLALRSDGVSSWRAWWLVSGAAVAALVGARVFNGLLSRDLYRAEPWRWFTPHAVGFSLYGGIIAGIIVGYFLARFLKVDTWRAADIAAPFVGIGIALIRVGCYLRGCCFGEPTDMPWGVTFPLFSQSHMAQLEAGHAAILSPHAVHPTQMYELLGALLAAGIAWVLARRRTVPYGVPALVAAIVFTLVRLATYFFRVMPESYAVSEAFYPILYVFALAVLIALLMRRAKDYGDRGRPIGGNSSV